MALTVQQFYDYSGLSSSKINEGYLTFVLENIQKIIEGHVGALFNLSTITSTDPITVDGNNTDLIKIGAWQPTGLEVKLYSYGTQNPTPYTLVYKRDYKFLRYRNAFLPGQDNPVVGIQLLSGFESTLGSSYGYDWGTKPKFRNVDYVEITGTYGWSDGMPEELTNLIFEVILEKVLRNKALSDTNGRNYFINSESDLTSSISYRKEAEDSGRRLAFDLTNDPAVKGLLGEYKRYSQVNTKVS